MASLYSKFLDFIGIEETDEEEDERDDYYRDRDDRYDDYRRNDRSDRDRGGRNQRDDYYSRSDRSSRDDRDSYYRDDRDDRDDEDNVVNFRRNQGSAQRQSAARQSQSRRERPAAPQQSNGANLPISGGMKMIVYHPVSYEDTQIIIDNLKNRKPVIVNMEELDVDCAQRILDFLSGAVYALSGTMCKISRGIFVVAPNNYDVVGNNDDFGDPL